MRESIITSLVFSVGLAVSACAGEMDAEEALDEEITETIYAGLDFSRLPVGLTAGLDHDFSPGGVGLARGRYDDLVATKYAFANRLPAAQGYYFQEIGDHGMSSGQGFKYQYLWRAAGDTYTSFFMPKGTVCGLKHTLNTPNIMCLGHDPAQNQCPPGFIAKQKGDWRAPSNGNFAWCEWQDPANLCASGECIDAVPAGLVCGLRSNAEDYEVWSPCAYVPETSGSECPDQFEFIGYYDAGRSAGRGLGWCQKRFVADP